MVDILAVTEVTYDPDQHGLTLHDKTTGAPYRASPSLGGGGGPAYEYLTRANVVSLLDAGYFGLVMPGNRNFTRNTLGSFLAFSNPAALNLQNNAVVTGKAWGVIGLTAEGSDGGTVTATSASFILAAPEVDAYAGLQMDGGSLEYRIGPGANALQSVQLATQLTAGAMVAVDDGDLYASFSAGPVGFEFRASSDVNGGNWTVTISDIQDTYPFNTSVAGTSTIGVAADLSLVGSDWTVTVRFDGVTVATQVVDVGAPGISSGTCSLSIVAENFVGGAGPMLTVGGVTLELYLHDT
jgi:hypothetical protein